MRRADRALLVLAVSTAGLFAWERTLAHGRDVERSRRGRVGKLLNEEERSALRVAALWIELPSGEEHLVARDRGRWRLMNYQRAPADSATVAGLVETLREAEGVLRSEDPSEASYFGVDSARRIRISLCGPRALEDPGRDVLQGFDVGTRLEGGGSFLRRAGSREVWAIDGDPRTPLEARVSPGLPPLLQPGVVRADWEGWASLSAVAIRPTAGDAAYSLRREPREVTPEELQQGVRPWTWSVVREGVEAPRSVTDDVGEAYVTHLRRIPYLGVLPGAERSDRLADSRATVILQSEDGPSLTLLVGRGVVWNDTTETLYAIGAIDEVRIAPGEELLTEGSAALWTDG